MARSRRRAERSRAAAPATVRRGRFVALAVAAALALVGVTAYVVVSSRAHGEAAQLLPPIPDLRGQPDTIVEHVRRADADARRAPSDAARVGALGMAYHSDLLYGPALQAYARAEQLDPANWRWPYYTALVHIERGAAPEAADALRRVVAANPTHALAWWRLGESAFKRARYDEAMEAYTRAETAARASSEPELRLYAGVGRARVAALSGDAAEAERILGEVIATEERFGPAHRVLADLLRARGRSAEADIHAARASTIKAYAAPGDRLLDELADESRSAVFLLRQAAATDLVRAAARREQLVRRAVDVAPDNPDMVYELGALLQMLHRPADALPLFQKHLTMLPGDQQTLVQIGKTLTDLRRYDEAETVLRRALALRDDAVAFYNLGVVLELKDRSDEAEASYRRAVALGPGLASARNNLGSLLAQSGRSAEAIVQLREAIRLDPSGPDAYTNMSALFLERGDMQEAANYARLAIAADPNHADAHANLAVAVANLGDTALAREHLNEALRLDPSHAQARRVLAALAR